MALTGAFRKSSMLLLSITLASLVSCSVSTGAVELATESVSTTSDIHSLAITPSDSNLVETSSVLEQKELIKTKGNSEQSEKERVSTTSADIIIKGKEQEKLNISSPNLESSSSSGLDEKTHGQPNSKDIDLREWLMIAAILISIISTAINIFFSLKFRRADSRKSAYNDLWFQDTLVKPLHELLVEFQSKWDVGAKDSETEEFFHQLNKIRVMATSTLYLIDKSSIPKMEDLIDNLEAYGDQESDTDIKKEHVRDIYALIFNIHEAMIENGYNISNK